MPFNNDGDAALTAAWRAPYPILFGVIFPAGGTPFPQIPLSNAAPTIANPLVLNAIDVISINDRARPGVNSLAFLLSCNGGGRGNRNGFAHSYLRTSASRTDMAMRVSNAVIRQIFCLRVVAAGTPFMLAPTDFDANCELIRDVPGSVNIPMGMAMGNVQANLQRLSLDIGENAVTLRGTIRILSLTPGIAAQLGPVASGLNWLYHLLIDFEAVVRLSFGLVPGVVMGAQATIPQITFIQEPVITRGYFAFTPAIILFIGIISNFAPLLLITLGILQISISGSPMPGAVLGGFAVDVFRLLRGMFPASASMQINGAVAGAVPALPPQQLPQLAALGGVLGANLMPTTMELDDFEVSGPLVPFPVGLIRSSDDAEIVESDGGLDLDRGVVVAQGAMDYDSADIVWRTTVMGARIEPGIDSAVLIVSDPRWYFDNLDLESVRAMSWASAEHGAIEVPTFASAPRPFGAVGERARLFVVQTNGGRFAKCAAWTDPQNRLRLRYVVFEAPAPTITIRRRTEEVRRERVAGTAGAPGSLVLEEYRLSHRISLRAIEAGFVPNRFVWSVGATRQRVEGSGALPLPDGTAIEYRTAGDTCEFVTPLGVTVDFEVHVLAVDGAERAATRTIRVRAPGVIVGVDSESDLARRVEPPPPTEARVGEPSRVLELGVIRRPRIDDLILPEASFPFMRATDDFAAESVSRDLANLIPRG